MDEEYVKMRKSNIRLTVRVTPVIPAFGNDNVVHICESKDHARKGTPCPSKV